MRRRMHCVKSNSQQDAVRAGEAQLLRLVADQDAKCTISPSVHAGLTGRVV